MKTPLLFAALFCCLVWSCMSRKVLVDIPFPDEKQQTGPIDIDIDPENYSMRTVRIYNSTRDNVVMMLGLRSNQLQRYTVNQMEVWVSPEFYSHETPLTVIKTGYKTTSYQLRTGSTYELFYNTVSTQYELQRIQVK